MRLVPLLTIFLFAAPGAAQDKKPAPAGGTLVWTLPWPADWVTSVAFLGPTNKLAAGNKLGQILVWELPEKNGDPAPLPVLRLDGHSNTVTGLVATPDGRWLISSSYDHTVRLWDLEQPAKGKGKAVLHATAGKKKPPKPLEADVAIHEPTKVLTAHQEWVRSLSYSADARQLLTGDDKGVVILWSIPEGKELRRMQAKGWLQAVALAPDGKRAATCEYAPRYATFPNAIRLWDATTGEAKLDLGAALKRKGSNNVMGMAAAAFARDGQVLALGQGGEVESSSGRILLLAAADGKKLHELDGHTYGVTALAFHSDGQHLASAGRDTTVRLWRVSDGQMVVELGKRRGGQFNDWIHAISFSADGRRLAAADMAGQVHVWSLPAAVAGEPTKPIAKEPELQRELLRRTKVDQEARNALIKWMKDNGADGLVVTAKLSAEKKAEFEKVAQRVTEIDEENTKWLKETVAKHGWPTYTLVGKNGAQAAWLLVQHADADPKFQRTCLDLMAKLPKLEVSQTNRAYLTDRVLLAEGKKQVYGTQFTNVGGKFTPGRSKMRRTWTNVGLKSACRLSRIT